MVEVVSSSHSIRSKITLTSLPLCCTVRTNAILRSEAPCPALVPRGTDKAQPGHALRHAHHVETSRFGTSATARPEQRLPRRAAAVTMAAIVRARPDPGHGTSEVDAHNEPAGRGVADLGEPGCRKGARGTDVQLLGDHFRGVDRICLDGARAALPGEVDGHLGEDAADTLSPEACPCEQAGHRPNAVVGLVLGPVLPGNAVVAQQALVGSARFDRAPADGLTVEMGEEAAGRVRTGMVAVGLLP